MRAPASRLAGLVVSALAAAVGAQGASAQPVDTLAARPTAPVVELSPARTAPSRTSRGAVTRALLLPGLGQVYNRQPVKAPIAAALAVGGVAFAVDRQRRYRRLQRATIYAGCDPALPGSNTYQTPERARLCARALDEYQDEWAAVGSPTFAAVGNSGGPRDRARGQRDVGVLVAVVAYAFQAFDAYVFAELADFDVSEDVAVRVEPGLEAPTLSLRVGL